MLQLARWSAIVANPLPPIILAVVIAVTPGSLFAQEEDEKTATITLNEEQRRLNNKATKALGEDPPDTSGAIRLIEAALAVGDEGNVLYMTLGRAHQKAGNCKSAEKAYEQSRRSAPVEGVPNEAVQSRLDRYTKELDDCYGTLRIACQSAEETTLRVSGRDVPCDQSARLEPGKHVVTARRGAARVDIPVDVVGGEEARVHVDLTAEDADEDTSGQFAGAAKNVVSVALTEANREVDSIARQSRQSQLNDSLVAAQITSGRVILAAEALTTRVQNASDAGTGSAAGDGTAAGASKKMVVGTPDHGEMAGTQVALLAPLGGFAVQGKDGHADGGLLYGVTVDGVFGWGFPKNLGIDAHIGFDFTTGEGLELKKVEGEDDQELGHRHWRVLGELRGWLHFLGVGVFLDHRSQTLKYPAEDANTRVWTAGPSVVLSSAGLRRAEGYFDFFARWAPLLRGDLGVFSVGFETTSGYLMVAMAYERFTGQKVPDAEFRGGETLMMKFGLRVPIQLARQEEE